MPYDVDRHWPAPTRSLAGAGPLPQPGRAHQAAIQANLAERNRAPRPEPSYPELRPRAPRFVPNEDRHSARSFSTRWARNPGVTGFQLAPQNARVARVQVMSDNGDETWFEFFTVPRDSITLGTTTPTFTIHLFDNGDDSESFSPPMFCPDGLFVFAVTHPENAVAAAAPHFATALLVDG